MSVLSNRVLTMAASATLAMSKRSQEMQAQGIDVINLSVGEPDFNTADARDRHKDAVHQRIAAWTADKTKYEVTEILGAAGVPVGPVLSTKEMMTDESLYDGNTLVRINQGGDIGEFVTVGCPFTMSNYQPQYGPCPSLGGNTDEVLKSLGYTDDQIKTFAQNGTTASLAEPKK